MTDGVELNSVEIHVAGLDDVELRNGSHDEVLHSVDHDMEPLMAHDVDTRRLAYMLWLRSVIRNGEPHDVYPQGQSGGLQ